MTTFYRFDSGERILSVTFTRTPTSDEFDTFIGELTRELKKARADKFGMLFKITVSAFDLGFEVPRKMSEWMKTNERFIKDHVIASAVQMSGISATLLLKTLFALRSSARPCKVFGLDPADTVKALKFIGL